MSTSKKASPEREARLKRVKAVLRSWDGPNSRVGFELDLDKMPWGPFDALGKHVSLLLPSKAEPDDTEPGAESEMERALRHVEHAADRCGEFARLGNGGDEQWRQAQRTWEWLRDRLTHEWLRSEVGRAEGEGEHERPAGAAPLPIMPGTAATLELVGKALRGIPLAQWRAAVEELDPDGPTREEAVQTLLGVARLMGSPPPLHPMDESDVGQVLEVSASGSSEITLTDVEVESDEEAPYELEELGPAEVGVDLELDPIHGEVTFEYAMGFDEGYRIGRRVGKALGERARLNAGQDKAEEPSS